MKRILLQLSLIYVCLNLPSYTFAELSTEEQLTRLADEYLADVTEMSQPYAYYYDIALNRHDKFINNDPAALARSEVLADNVLAKLRAINVQSLKTEQQSVFHSKFIEALETRVQQRVCKSELWNISHMSGPHTLLDFLVNVQPVETIANRQDALARWKAAAQFYSQEISNLKEGLKH